MRTLDFFEVSSVSGGNEFNHQLTLLAGSFTGTSVGMLASGLILFMKPTAEAFAVGVAISICTGLYGIYLADLCWAESEKPFDP